MEREKEKKAEQERQREEAATRKRQQEEERERAEEEAVRTGVPLKSKFVSTKSSSLSVLLSHPTDRYYWAIRLVSITESSNCWYY